MKLITYIKHSIDNYQESICIIYIAYLILFRFNDWIIAYGFGKNLSLGRLSKGYAAHAY